MKVLYFSDPHNSDVAPVMRTDTYTEDIIKKQEFLIKPAKKASLVVCGGDIFHTKRTDKISYKLVNRLLEIYREYGETVILVGNHDSGGEEDVDYRPLGLFSHLPNVSVVTEQYISYEDDSIVFMFLGGHRDYDAQTMSASLKRMITKAIPAERKEDVFRVVVAHAPIVSGLSDEYPFPTIPFKSVGRYAHLFMIGHLHNFVCANERILSAGALSRGSLSFDDDFNRKIYYGDVDIRNLECQTELVDIPHKDANEIFRVSAKMDQIKNEAAESSIVEMIDSLGAVDITDLESIKHRINVMDIEEAVKTKAVKILQEI